MCKAPPGSLLGRTTLFLAAAALLAGCGTGTESLISDFSTDISETSTETVWSSNGEDVNIDEFNFSATQPLRASQEFQVSKDTKILLTTDDLTELPGGVDLTYTIRRDGEFVKTGKATELLVQPTVVELQPGMHTMEMEINRTYEYENSPSADHATIEVPRIIMEDVR